MTAGPFRAPQGLADKSLGTPLARCVGPPEVSSGLWKACEAWFICCRHRQQIVPHGSARCSEFAVRPPPSCWLRRIPLGLWLSLGPQGSSRPTPVLNVCITRGLPPQRSRSIRNTSTLRCHGLALHLSPVSKPAWRLPKIPGPFGVFGTEANSCRACRLPATVGTSRVSHPHRALTAPRAFRACFIPEPPVGFHPSGPSPFAEP